EKVRLLRSGPTLSLVIPTRNEAENVSPLVARLAHALDGTDYELLFVDDSDDATPAVIEREMAVYPSIYLLHREEDERTGGLATAVLEGTRQARGAYIGVLDGDLQHPPELVPTLLAAVQDADLVVASRYIPGGSNSGLDSIVRQLVSRGSTAIASALFSRVR